MKRCVYLALVEGDIDQVVRRSVGWFIRLSGPWRERVARAFRWKGSGEGLI